MLSPQWNPGKNYSQDEGGQWWYTTAAGMRSRCKARACDHCAEEFWVYVCQYKTRRYCSRRCFGADIVNHPERTNGIGSRPNLTTGIKGRIIRRGYVLLWMPDHPDCAGNTRTYVAEHRVVMEQQLGRRLERHEQVHHINGNRADNRPENLEMWTRGHPTGVRVTQTQHCATCTCGEHQPEE